MQETKNNAVEKVESIANNNASENSSSPKTDKAIRSSNGKKREIKNRKKQERHLAKEQARIEREKIWAERRIELARIKAHKKAEREKAQASYKRLKEAKKAEKAQKRAQLIAERQKHIEMLRHETKQQREARIKSEREERAKQSQQRYMARQRERQLKREHKARQKESRKGYGGWLAAVISLGIASLVLASVLTVTLIMPSKESTMLESVYSKSFYETLEQVNSLDANLSKAIATNDKSALPEYLMNIAVESELAEDNISQLPIRDEYKFYTSKLINQIGDYAKYLNKKLANGESLSESDVAVLNNLYNANVSLKNSLYEINQKSRGQFNFTALAKGNKNSLVIDSLENLENLSVEMPQLIYDGPFSDGLENRTVKGLSGEEILPTEAISIFNKAFNGMGIKDVKSDGETSGQIECYNVSGMIDDDILYAQISKKGGKMIMFAYSGSCKESNFGEESAIKSAQEFMAGIEITDMMPVWTNKVGNVYTINFAYSLKGVPVYSDIVKVRVCAETNKVIGLEAFNYYLNHTSRTLEKAQISKTEAMKNVSANIEIESSRLAIVPIGNTSEKLCYEFMGTYNESTYYVYIDAKTGKQIQMFKVVDGTEGKLLV